MRARTHALVLGATALPLCLTSVIAWDLFKSSPGDLHLTVGIPWALWGVYALATTLLFGFTRKSVGLYAASHAAVLVIGALAFAGWFQVREHTRQKDAVLKAAEDKLLEAKLNPCDALERWSIEPAAEGATLVLTLRPGVVEPVSVQARLWFKGRLVHEVAPQAPPLAGAAQGGTFRVALTGSREDSALTGGLDLHCGAGVVHYESSRSEREFFVPSGSPAQLGQPLPAPAP
jgi:hypothetical protein